MKKYYNFNYYVLEHVAELNLTSDEVIVLLFLRYLSETQQEVVLEHVSKAINLSLITISKIIDSLLEKKMISISYNNGEIEYNTNEIFKVLERKENNQVAAIFRKIEVGFKRIISQKEVEKINDLLKTYDPNLVEYALRETLLQEVDSLAYMEKILMNWQKLNYTAEDYENGKTTFK